MKREGLTFSSRPVVTAPVIGRGKGDIKVSTVEASMKTVSLTPNKRDIKQGENIKPRNQDISTKPQETMVKKEKKISSRMDPHKTSNPFGNSKQGKTGFADFYTGGSVPCRINHGGSGINKLQWDKDPSSLEYFPLLVHCCEGIAETTHPYAFIARAAFKELLLSPGGAAKALPLTSLLVKPIRVAFLSADEGVFEAVLVAVQQLSEAVKEELTPHLGALLIQINKKIFNRKFANQIQKTLLALDQNGGPDAYPLIKAKVPTYGS